MNKEQPAPQDKIPVVPRVTPELQGKFLKYEFGPDGTLVLKK